MYAEIDLNNPNKLVKYPANPWQDNPNMSIPQGWHGGVLCDRCYVLIQASMIPHVDTGFMVVEGKPVLKDGKWTQAWNKILVSPEELRATIKARRAQAEAAGVKVDGVLYDADDKALNRYNAIMFEIMLLNDNVLRTWTVDLVAKDNSVQTVGAAQFKKIFLAVRNHQQHAMDRQQELFAAIDTVDEATIEALKFGEGWPA